MIYNIYFVSNDHDIGREVVEFCLEHEGWRMTTFGDDSDPFARVADSPDLWILDVDNETGFKILREVRKNSESVGIILISEREKIIDRVLGLELGCDDLIIKPFAPRELILRSKKFLKRLESIENYPRKVKLQNFWLDRDRHVVIYNDQNFNLTSKEFDILFLFAQNKGIALSRKQIIRLVWGENYYGSERVVDDLIRRIRNKIESFEVETLYGYGYRVNS